MSIRTTADEKRDDAVEHVTKAIDALREIVIDECWGSRDFTGTYRKALEDAFDALRKVKQSIRRD